MKKHWITKQQTNEKINKETLDNKIKTNEETKTISKNDAFTQTEY